MNQIKQMERMVRKAKSNNRIDYNSFFMKENLEELYSIKLDKSNEREWHLRSKLPRGR